MRFAVALTLVLPLLVVVVSGCYRRAWHNEESKRIDAIIGRGWEPLSDSVARGIPVPRDESVGPPPTIGRQRRAAGKTATAGREGKPTKDQERSAKSSKPSKKQARTDFRFSGF